MARANLLGRVLLLVAMLCAIAVLPRALRARRFGIAALSVPPILVHPGWWLSASIGDCGNERVALALWVTQLSGLLWAGFGSGLMRRRRGAVLGLALSGLALGGAVGMNAIRFPDLSILALAPSLLACWTALTEWLLDQPLRTAVRNRASLPVTARRVLWSTSIISVALAAAVLQGALILFGAWPATPSKGTLPFVILRSSDAKARRSDSGPGRPCEESMRTTAPSCPAGTPGERARRCSRELMRGG